MWRQIIYLKGVTQSIEDIEYFQEHQDPTYGEGTIFNSTRIPTCFIIRTQRVFQNPAILELFKSIENQQNISLIGLYAYEQAAEWQCSRDCNGSNRPITTLYWQFLPYSLQQLWQHRQARRVRFSEGQLWHIVKQCAIAYETLDSLKTLYKFNQRSLLVNHQGSIRVFWGYVEVDSRYSLDQTIQLSLGYLILKLALLELRRQVYLRPQVIHYFFCYQFIYELRFHYSQSLCSLIGSLIHPNPQQRIAVHQISPVFAAQLTSSCLLSKDIM